jgi:hypothetical protein
MSRPIGLAITAHIGCHGAEPCLGQVHADAVGFDEAMRRPDHRAILMRQIAPRRHTFAVRQRAREISPQRHEGTKQNINAHRAKRIVPLLRGFVSLW